MSEQTNLTLKELFVEYLQTHGGQSFKSRDIATALKDLHSSKYAAKDLGQLSAEISAGAPKWLPLYPQIQCSDETPRRYSWDPNNSLSFEFTPEKASSENVFEESLYPLLAEFLVSQPRKIYPKRINEKKSSNSFGTNGNKWLHPDIVGMEDLSSGWKYELKDWTAKAGARQAKLWSFEVKVDITRSNVRPYYFQAVSNSTWANYGYLVAISLHPSVLSELRILNELHGIGVIKLDTQDPVGSTEIPIPARERTEVDWGTCNRIAAENPDFQEYIRLIAQFYDTRNTHESLWDVP